MSYAKSTSFLHQECNLQSITSQDLVHADHAVVACNMTNKQACIFAVLSLYASSFMKYKESEVHGKHLREKILCANLHYFEEHPRKSQNLPSYR